MIYKKYDGLKTIQGHIISEVIEIRNFDNTIVSKVKQTFQDKNKKDTKIAQTEYKYANGWEFLSLKNMLPRETWNSINTIQGLTVHIESNDLKIHNNSKEENKLTDVVIKITALVNGIPIIKFNGLHKYHLSRP